MTKQAYIHNLVSKYFNFDWNIKVTLLSHINTQQLQVHARDVTATVGNTQWCIAKNGGGYMQMGVAKGLKVPCLFMITEVSIRCPKNPEVGVQRIPAYTPPPIYHW